MEAAWFSVLIICASGIIERETSLKDIFLARGTTQTNRKVVA